MQDKRPEAKYEFKLNFKEITLFLVGSIGVISLFFIVGIWIGKSLNAVPADMISDEFLTTQDFPAEDAGDAETEIDVSNKGDNASYDFQKSLAGEKIIPLKDEGKSKTTKKAPAISKKEETKPAKEKKVRKGRYTIQVASLKSDKSALKLVGRLEKKGYDAYFIVTNLKDKGVWYRVRVGNYHKKDDAKKDIKNIEKAIKMKGMVVRDSRN
jgi:cell division septation protein DedD